MLPRIENVDAAVRSIEDLNQLAESVARKISIVEDRHSGEWWEAALAALRGVEHDIRRRAAELEEILATNCDVSDAELANLLRRQDVASHGVLYR